MRRALRATFLLATLALAAAAGAEQLRRFGDLEVHYIAFATAILDPQIAERYGVTRAGHRALVNVAGRRRRPDGVTVAVPIEVTGQVTDLLGQRRDLSFREVREGDAIYYLDTVEYANEETLRFELLIRDPETGRSHPLTFQQKLWHELAAR